MSRRVTRWVSGIALAAVLVPASVQAQSLIGTSQFYKVVDHGKSVQVAFYDSLDPTCHSLGFPHVNLLTAPNGGEIQTGSGMTYSNFSPTNPRSACNKRKTPATLLFYHANANYTGSDTFEVEAVFPDGDARKYRYVVEVR